MASAAHVAVMPQVPVPLVIVMRAFEFEQAPFDVITAVVLELVVEATVNWLPYTALDGAPVKVTVGVAKLAVVDWFSVAPV